MRIEYSISLWNYGHYTASPSLERAILTARDHGYGVEVWNYWEEEKDLFDEVGRARLKSALEDMTVTLHTAGGKPFESSKEQFEFNKKQIDAAAALKAKLVVVHPKDLVADREGELDPQLARDVAAYAHERQVKLALENGRLAFLVNAIAEVPGLGICLDVGHVYKWPEPMSSFLATLGDRIIHLHIQDTLPESESGLPYTGGDHYIPGTGGIPQKDWELLAATLKQVNFEGIAVFEIRPRNPLQTALLGTRFFEGLFEEEATPTP